VTTAAGDGLRTLAPNVTLLAPRVTLRVTLFDRAVTLRVTPPADNPLMKEVVP
jgi:hypothetical protein